MKVVLGVGGGVAAYKSALLLRLFTEEGHDVTVLPTTASLNFVGAATWEALSGRPAPRDVFEDVEQVNHVRLGHEADLVVVAPATADLLARAAHGLADDLLTNTLLVATCPVLFVPAMHTQMWQHPATVANVATLRSRGAHVLDPAVGRLTGCDSGPGRLPDPPDIHAAAIALVAPDSTERPVPARDAVADGVLSGRRVLITAGGTREPLDPVRYLGNRSSGKQGVALACAARDAGAHVTLIGANLQVEAPDGVDLVTVETTDQLHDAVLAATPDADLVVMAAAVADFRPRSLATHKIKKSDDGTDPVIELTRTPDILAEISANRARPGQVIVGFAAETGDDTHTALEFARAKLARKGCDALVLNEVTGGAVFGQDSTAVHVVTPDGNTAEATGTKDDVAVFLVGTFARIPASTVGR
ncbi:bifunctional phosphopantothenoylcysteine decarboxylase/phosphopantothenate--cysteine ligase CoaBC [Tersicoccus sp. Bi-70]|uniref:bifunctional phosphopantothenoylcysteine decarboxylase/phosphopantothenate--cysteine ligase CoaBC n=1 Tax=Tersicoccus sp. Bi-70 TaxID=1897634 RepID=UPI000978C230|nr:bifunctional phosphopantothenoylcysteine decarboxylase/phosphopantothenate--cysteine ligase CoaBC [Tersicoccus sp. Bi-70]OMH37038.1 phosphopantothenoylcysteine decarboxylase [Tersicoccus sp. Bi-70]